VPISSFWESRPSHPPVLVDESPVPLWVAPVEAPSVSLRSSALIINSFEMLRTRFEHAQKSKIFGTSRFT
jgi:hypothetical protein